LPQELESGGLIVRQEQGGGEAADRGRAPIAQTVSGQLTMAQRAHAHDGREERG
jgi:hypothetical protein